MMRRFIALLLAVAMLAAAGCSKTSDNKEPSNQSGQKEQVVRINIGADPETLDPATSTGVPEANVELALFEGLMRLDKDGKPVPGVAADMPEIKDDGLTYVFKIRDDAKWSNGDPVTAHDFVWSWTRVLDPRTASDYAYQLYYIKGAQKLNTIPLNKVGPDGQELKGPDGKAIPRDDQEIAADVEAAAKELGVKALDDKTLEVRLEAPTPYFLSLTAFHSYYPVHRKSVEAHPEDWFRKPETLVGNGPFKLQSWTAKDKLVVVKNPNYYDADKVKLERIEYYMIDNESTATTMFESGELDILESGVNSAELDRLKVERKDELHILPDLSVYFYRFNVTKPPLNDARVRKALAYAIDRKALVENVTKAGQTPAMGIVPPGILEDDGTDFRQKGGDYFKDADIETAKKLLAEAGYPDGKGFPKLTIMYNTSEAHKRIAEAVQEMWKKNLGIDVELQNQEWQVYLANQSSLNYDISRAGWQGDYIDPMTFLDMFVTGGGNNNTGWSNPTYDQLIQKAKTTGDQKVRMEALHQAEKILMDEMPIMPIYYYVRVRLVSTKVKNWIEPLTSGMDLRDAYIE